MKIKITDIDIDTFKGIIPPGHDLVIYESGSPTIESATILYGFDEVGLFDSNYITPQYGFVKSLCI